MGSVGRDHGGPYRERWRGIAHPRKGDHGPLDSIDGVAEVSMENGAIHVTYDPLQTTEKKIEESIRASGNSVTSAATDSETPRPVTGPGLAATREPAARE